MGGLFNFDTLSAANMTPAKYEEMAKNGYIKNAAAYSAINMIVKNFAEMDIKIYDYSKGIDKKIIVENWDNESLLDKPNKSQSPYCFKESLCGYFMLSGNSYILPITARGGKKPVEFYTIRPDIVCPVISKNGLEVLYYEVGYEPNKIKIPANLMFHAKNFNPLDSFLGISPLSSILADIDMNNEAKVWNVSLQQNMGKPSGIVSAKTSLNKEQFNRLEKQVRAKFQGSRNVGNVWIGDGDLKWEKTSLTPTEMDWLEGLKFSKTEIVTALGVAPELLGIGDHKTYSNMQEARTALYNETIIPLFKFFMGEMSRWLHANEWLNENYWLEPDLSSIIALKENENELYTRLSGATWMTDNEKRARTGLPVDEKRVTWNLTKFEQDLLMAKASASTAKPADAKLLESVKSIEVKSRYVHTQPSLVYVRSQADKDIVAKTFEDERERLEATYAIEIRKMLEVEHARVMSTISKAQADWMISALAARAVDEGFVDWGLLLGSGDKAVAKVFAETAIKDIASSLRGINTGMWNAQDVEDGINTYVNNTIGESITSINDTSKKQINQVISKGIQEGKSVAEISKDINELYIQDITPTRARMIAQTETIKAANLGEYLAAQTAPIQMEKVWLSTGDARTRHNHVLADKQQVGINDKFLVGGDEMLFPGDVSLGAAAGNTINCRCTMYFEPTE